MGWLFLLLFITLAFATLWRFGKLPTVALQVSAAALMIAAMGYAWQGSPSLSSTPAAALRQAPAIDTSAALSRPMKPAFTREEMAVNTAEALIRAHNTTGAISLLKDELKGTQRQPMLWVALGNALVAHNGGIPSPASDYAFKRADALGLKPTAK
jgi:hypothetical protein